MSWYFATSVDDAITAVEKNGERMIWFYDILLTSPSINFVTSK
jgi:hypothetical protein